MQLKYCDCGNSCIVTAKYCGACGCAFPAVHVEGKSPAAVVIPQKPILKSKQKQTYVFDSDESEGEEQDTNTTLPELDEEFVNGFLDFVISNGVNKPPTTKFGDVVGSAKSNRKALGKRKSDSPKSAKAILKSTENRKRKE